MALVVYADEQNKQGGALLESLRSESDPYVASRAGTLRGKELFLAGLRNGNITDIQEAVKYFVIAATKDPSNEDAKYNLELLVTAAQQMGLFPLDPRDLKPEADSQPGRPNPIVGY